MQRVPAAFEVLHHGVDLVAIHQLDELAAQPSVAVLAAERALVFLDQQGGFVGHRAELAQTFRFLDIYDRPQMQFARADMGMVDATQAQSFKHFGEVGHIGGQLLGRDGSVFDDTDGLGIAFHAGQKA